MGTSLLGTLIDAFCWNIADILLFYWPVWVLEGERRSAACEAWPEFAQLMMMILSCSHYR
jgi:hypothetical protein